EVLRSELERLVSLSSLSVYRLRNGENIEFRERNNSYAISPVDYRLNKLLNNLTVYQLELSKSATEISNRLQKEVLASILYSQEGENIGIPKDFNKEEEKRNLTSAYKQLGAFDSDIRKRINTHVDSVDKTISYLDKATALAQEGNTDAVELSRDFDYRSLEALRKTQKIIQMSLDAESQTSEVYAPLELLTEILSDFIKDKTFSFDSGGNLIVENEFDKITALSLSSGEKQLLILFIETLLQRSEPFIFLTDEPEISLHISWQRKILPAIKRLNPNAQVIAATHSPEVAAKYKNNIVDMEKMIHD
uniref:AAA family ATPase n=1 Tax=Vibrio campbellii TaxID=680 RepID=UPI0006891806